MHFTSKLPQVGTTIFTVMSALAKEHQAINLSQGFPDFNIDAQLIERVHHYMLQGYNQYAPMPGLPELRQALAQKVMALYNKALDPENEITITPGATYAIYTAFATILDKDDEVIVLEPAYDSYMANIIALGAKPVGVDLELPDFSVNWDKVKQAITNQTKAIIINTPHNPCGYIFTEEDWKQLAQLVSDRNIFIISDEVYEHLTFDGAAHHSILKYPELWDRCIATYSFGKVFHATGWKMGYAIAPKSIMAEYRKIHQFLCFTCNTPMQYALADYLQDANHYLNLSAFYEQKRNLFLSLLKDTRLVVDKVTQGSYFQVVNYQNISQLGDREFCTWLTTQHGVAAIPLSAFYSHAKDDKLIRLCFAKKEETIRAALERLKAL